NYEFQFQAIRIEKAQVFFTEFFGRFVVNYIVRIKAFHPEIEAAFRHGVANFGGHARSFPALPDSFPGKESKNSTRAANFVAKVKMVGARIVEIYGFLQKAQAQRFSVKI